MQKYYDIIIIGTPKLTYAFNFGLSEDAFSLSRVRLIGKCKWEIMRQDFPRWHKERLKVFASHSVDRWMQTEYLPNVENLIEIAKNKEIKVYYRLNNQISHGCLRYKFKKALRKAGFLIIFAIPMLLKSINYQGGSRFANDSTVSVLNLNCRTHDIDNLVVDSIFFLIKKINPTLISFC